MNKFTRKDFLKGALGSAAVLAASGCAERSTQGTAQGAYDSPSSKPGRDLILSDAMVITMDDKRRAFKSGYVWMRDGRIHRVGATVELTDVPNGITRRSLNGRLIMPGLVNSHTHGDALVRGLYDELSLAEWYGGVMWGTRREAAKPSTAQINASGAAGIEPLLLEQMMGGVTTIACGGAASVGPLTAITRSGVRAVVSRSTVNSTDDHVISQFTPKERRETPTYAVEQTRAMQREFNSDRVSIVPEALGVLRCTADMVVAMHDLAVETKSHFFMHAASSVDERDESKRRFGHGSITELERLGVLGPKTMLAHCIWLDDAEIKLLAERQTGVSHNPVANAYYAEGLSPLPKLLASGVRVGLGTDGAATNNGQNLWETMKMAMLFQKQALETAHFGSAELALELVTRGAAAALHMENEIGSLEVGKRADLIVIDMNRVALSPPQTIVSNLVYSNDRWAVRDVYVEGEPVVLDGVHQRLDSDAVIKQYGSAVENMLKQSGRDTYLKERSKWQWQ